MWGVLHTTRRRCRRAPENLTTSQFVDVFHRGARATGKVSHVPRAAMRIAAVLMPVINPAVGRQIRAGLVMDMASMGRNDSEFRSRYPSIPVTTLADVVKRDFVGSAVATELAAAS